MRVDEIRAIARERGIKTGKMKKEELIRAIQLAEGNSDCFGMLEGRSCGQAECLWSTDCPSA